MLAIDWMKVGRITGVMLALSMGSAAASDHCPTSGDERVTIVAVQRRLELQLADGRTLRLAGLDPVEQTPDNADLEENARAALETMIAGLSLSIHVVAAAPDRWNRVVALVFASTASTIGSNDNLTARAISMGLARYLAEPAARGCRETLVAAETAARAAKLGLWSDPYYAVLTVDDSTAFMERSGTTVVAEGRLAAVAPGPYRTKLLFTPTEQGSRGGHLLSATILPRTMKTFEARRLIPSSFIGRIVRFRGLLDLRFGPQIEIADPDQIDIVGPVLEAAPGERAH